VQFKSETTAVEYKLNRIPAGSLVSIIFNIARHCAVTNFRPFHCRLQSRTAEWTNDSLSVCL